MRRILFLVLLLGLSPTHMVWGSPSLTRFQPADRSFRISVPGQVKAVEMEEERFLWGSDDGRTGYLFGYTVIPRAATMAEDDLRIALGQFLTNYLANAKVIERTRASLTWLTHVGVDSTGTGTYGASWIRILAVGPRIYVLSSDGTSETEHKAFVESFKLLPSGR